MQPLYMCAYEMIAQVFFIIGVFIYCRLQVTDLALCYCYILKNIIYNMWELYRYSNNVEVLYLPLNFI